MAKTHIEPGESQPLEGAKPSVVGRTLNNAWSEVVVFVVCVAVYASTMSRSISGGDAGELAVSACQLGVAHPPGYPLFTFIYHAVWRYASLILDPWAPKAALVFNATSVVLMALAMAFLSSTIRCLTGSHTISSITTLAFAFSPTIWLYSGQAEVFALHICLMTLLLRTLFWLYEDPSLKRACLFYLIASISLTNQHTSVLFVAPFCLLILIDMRRHLLLPKAIIMLTLSVAAGLSSYMLLPYLSGRRHLDSWGDLTTIDGFLRHLLRQEYGTFQLASAEIATEHPFLSRVALYAQHLLLDSQYVFVIMGVIGVFVSLRSKSFQKQRHPLIALLAGFSVYIVVFHYLANLDLTPFLLGVQMRFWMQPNIVVFVWASLTWSQLRYRCRYLVDAIAVAALSAQIATNLPKRDFSGPSPILAYGRSILDSLPAGSIALLNGDLNNNAVKYLAGCEGERNDLRLISLQLMSWNWFVRTQARHYPGVVFPGEVYHPYREGGFSILQFLEANRERFPIYLCGNWKHGDESHQQLYELIPSGICNKIVRKDKLPTDSERTKIMKKGAIALPKLEKLDSSQITPDLWESIVYNDVWQRKITLFNELSQHAAGSPAASKKELRLLVRLAESLFEETPADINHLQPEIFRNAGVIFGMYSVHIQKYEQRMMQAWRRYLDKTTRPDATISNIVEHNYNPYRGSSIA